MNIKKGIVERELSYLDTHQGREGLVTGVLAAFMSHRDIAEQHKAAYVAAHKARVASGDITKLGPASASLKFAAQAGKEGVLHQENTWQRRRELIQDAIFLRRRNLKEFPSRA